MKLAFLSPAFALLIAGTIALPASIPKNDVSVPHDPSPPRPFPKYALDGANQLAERDPLSRFPTIDEEETADPSPPRPFPAGRIVEDDSWQPRLSPKHRLVEGNPLEERVPLALSRFPTDEVDVINDPSPPRPFSAGRIVEASPPLEQRDPSAPHKLVDIQTAATDPAPPRPFPAGRPVASNNSSSNGTIIARSPSPLLRNDYGSQAEVNDPSPPRPFPAGRLVAANDSSANGTINPRSSLPLLRENYGSQAEINDPSPPRPFPAGRLVAANDSSSNGTISPRSASPLLRTNVGTEAEAKDPSPPRPFPAGRLVETNSSVLDGTVNPNDPSPLPPLPASHTASIEPQAEDPRIPPHRGHGGYFPPSNPPNAEPTPSATVPALGNRDVAELESQQRCDPLNLLTGCWHALPIPSDSRVTIDNLTPLTTTTASTPTETPVEFWIEKDPQVGNPPGHLLGSVIPHLTEHHVAFTMAPAADRFEEDPEKAGPRSFRIIRRPSVSAQHDPNRRLPIATAFVPRPNHAASTSVSTSSFTTITTANIKTSTAAYLNTTIIANATSLPTPLPRIHLGNLTSLSFNLSTNITLSSKLSATLSRLHLANLTTRSSDLSFNLSTNITTFSTTLSSLPLANLTTQWSYLSTNQTVLGNFHLANLTKQWSYLSPNLPSNFSSNPSNLSTATLTTTTASPTTTTTPCTTTLTSFSFPHLHAPPTTTLHAHTATSTRTVNCADCALASTTVNVGSGNTARVAPSKVTVADQGTKTVWVGVCGGTGTGRGRV